MRLRNRIARAVVVVACAALVLCVGSATALAQEEGGMKVTESGVGTGVVDRDLQGRAGEFPEGTEVWFWTRVEGGGDGDYLVHVWLHDGDEVYRHESRVGGSHWRTWSSKNLYGGSAGEWIVEARNEDGLVLARDVFRCTAPE